MTFGIVELKLGWDIEALIFRFDLYQIVSPLANVSSKPFFGYGLRLANGICFDFVGFGVIPKFLSICIPSLAFVF